MHASMRMRFSFPNIIAG